MAGQSLKFIHLRAHSAYSLLEGALPIKDMAKLCAAEVMPAVAITDTNNLFGALEFSDTMAGAGIQPIIGCTLSVDFHVASQDDKAIQFSQNEASYEQGRRAGQR